VGILEASSPQRSHRLASNWFDSIIVRRHCAGLGGAACATRFDYLNIRIDRTDPRFGTMQQGVVYREKGKPGWVAVVTGLDGKLVTLGSFETREEAKAAVRIASPSAVEHHPPLNESSWHAAACLRADAMLGHRPPG